jgi:integrase/recombinase XerD
MMDAVVRYLDQRRSLGYKDADLCRDLISFAKFSAGRGSDYITLNNAIAWVDGRKCRSDTSRRFLLSCVRRLGLYLLSEDNRHEILSEEFTRSPKRHRRPIPFIYSDTEIRQLIKRLSKHRLMHPYDSTTYEHLIGLIAVTGLRIGEAISLLKSDLSGNELFVRKGKFGKDRVVHLDSSTVTALGEYLSRRPRHLKSTSIFITHKDRAPSKHAIESAFRACANEMGLFGRNGSGLPRVHDLRHTFAVRSLASCPPDKDAVSNHIIALSTYLGHVSLDSTYWYLEISTETKELMALAMEEVFDV